MSEIEEMKREIASLQEVAGKVWKANAEYYATRDTAKAEAYKELLLAMHRQTLEKLGGER